MRSKAMRAAPILLLLLLIAVAACDDERPPSQQRHSIPLGALVDNTGSGATLLYGAAVNLAAWQMNDGINAVGGSIRFDLLLRDSRGDAANSQALALGLINQQGIKGLVADISGVTLAVNTLNYDPAKGALGKVPIACYACSSAFFNDPSYTDADPIKQVATRDPDNWLYRVFFNSKYESLLQTRIALAKAPGKDGDLNGDGKFKVGILAQDDAFGQASANKTRESLALLAPADRWLTETVYISPLVDVNTHDWTGDLVRLLDQEDSDQPGQPKVSGAPDAIFLALLPNLSMAAVKAYREAAFTTPVMSTTAFRRAYILQSLGAAANGVEGNSPPLYVDDESGRAFNGAMTAANGEPPEQLCSGAYDAAVTLMLASLVAAVPLTDPSAVTREAIRDAMPRLFDPAGEIIRPAAADFGRAYQAIKGGRPIQYKGASGVKFDAAGENYPLMVHWQVEGGKFKELEAYECSPQQPMCARTN